MSGKVAVLLGVDVDASVSVDTKPAQAAVVNAGTSAVTETAKAAETVDAPVKQATDAVAEAGKSAGKAAKKLKFW
jgi:hypothetical protein